MRSVLRPLFGMMSPAGRRARLSVFIFHRVHAQPDPIFPAEVDARRFDAMLGWIGRWFNVLPLDRAARELRRGTLPERAAAITFDDGYADNHAVALPLLRQHGLPATFFIATGFLDGGRMFNDTVIESVRGARGPSLDLAHLGLGSHEVATMPGRQAAIREILRQIKYRPADERLALTRSIAEAAGVVPPDDLMMRSADVVALHRAGMQIGAHTMTHPILARSDLEVARQEIAQSRDVLEKLLGERVGLFAYPNGRVGVDYEPQHARLVESLGFDAAVTTDWGAADAATDSFRIPRFTPWDRARTAFGLRMLRNLRLGGPARPSVTADKGH